MPSDEFVAEQTSLDELSNERRHAYEAVPPTDRNGVLRAVIILGCGYREPPEDVMAQLVNKRSRMLGTVWGVAELLEESWQKVWDLGTACFPCDMRNSFHKFMNRYELLAEDVFDPVLDLRCDLVVL